MAEIPVIANRLKYADHIEPQTLLIQYLRKLWANEVLARAAEGSRWPNGCCYVWSASSQPTATLSPISWTVAAA